MGCLIGKHKVADTFSGPHEFELNVPLLEFYEDWEDIKFWEAVNHDFDPKDPMVSLEDLSPDKNARRILCRRKKTSELGRERAGLCIRIGRWFQFGVGNGVSSTRSAQSTSHVGFAECPATVSCQICGVSCPICGV